ncbi:MAG: class I SAM-dependent methyltransferase [Oscillospiraceae bacterium]|jgi:ubiquinone/menaquinone biosynthesis C-methylase UbiE|nr:class I SAM-dependent methyltransferase [Oscillospiraceae bacterium]
MSTEIFTGKAEAYASARPGYPEDAIDYICSLAAPDAVFIDVGAGTGKFTLPLAERGYSVFAVEPNADMREKLSETLSARPNAKIINGSAEATTLPGACADIITCAQALHWLDPDAFRAECRRIGKPGGLVVAVYNVSPGGNSGSHSEQATAAFFTDPATREFPNPISYTRESWLQYMTSHSHDPRPSDPVYAAHIAEANAVFDRESVNGLLRRDVVTKVYSERIVEI